MALWVDIARATMRRDDGSNGYINSYARNDDGIWGRYGSSQGTRATLVQGRYASPLAWTNTNPDYQEELTYGGADASKNEVWTRVFPWTHIWLTETYRDRHTGSFVKPGNTRVMIWDVQVWVKSKATGQWRQACSSNTPSGEWWSPNFRDYLGGAQSVTGGYRIEAATGYPSVRTVYAPTGRTTGDDAYVDYWLWHGYGSFGAIDGEDVADVVASSRVSLVLHDPAGVDDRADSRYLYSMGADYYPAGKLPTYPGVGTGRQRIVTARYPNFEYHTMHTMTLAQFNAPGGYPSYFDGLSDGSAITPPDPGDGGGGGGGGGGTVPPVVAPTRGSWFAKLTGGASSWATRAIANVAANKVRRRRGNRFWS